MATARTAAAAPERIARRVGREVGSGDALAVTVEEVRVRGVERRAPVKAEGTKVGVMVVVNQN